MTPQNTQPQQQHQFYAEPNTATIYTLPKTQEKRRGLFAQLLRATFFRRDVFGLAFALIALASCYWLFLASDRYVSEARLVVDKVDLSAAPSLDFSSMLVGSQSSRDQLILRDYLLSADMMKRLETELNLRAHYSDPAWDFLSRLTSAHVPDEKLHNYYLKRVSVEPDSYSDILVIRAEAYTPEIARAITQYMIRDGEAFMNNMAHALALEQVGMLEKQVGQIQQRLTEARAKVIAYQNTHNLISPEGAIANVSSIASEMESKLADLRIRREALLSYLNTSAPDVVNLDAQISAIEQQLEKEQNKLTLPAKDKGKSTVSETNETNETSETSQRGTPSSLSEMDADSPHALNQIAEEYERLKAEVQLLQDMYNSGLMALEKGRVDATRTVKKLSTVQAPTSPQFSTEPRRSYNILVFALYTLLLAGIVHLLTAIIKEHKD